MSRILITYFSAEGNTAKVAKEAAEKLEADIFEIVPEEPYTQADINWKNPLSRCNKEKMGRKDVPVAGKIDNFDDYDLVMVGFPIWYGIAPNVVNTFCKGYDWSGKKVYAFATSGGSGIGKSGEKLKPYLQGASSVDAKLVHSADEVVKWVEKID